jgi:hypothetical protein
VQILRGFCGIRIFAKCCMENPWRARSLRND